MKTSKKILRNLMHITILTLAIIVASIAIGSPVLLCIIAATELNVYWVWFSPIAVLASCAVYWFIYNWLRD